MKKIVITAALLISFKMSVYAQRIEYKVLTSIESIVPMGIGRSTLIENKEEANLSSLTTEREEGSKSNQGNVKRKDAKIDNFAETKLLNFYSAVGINFQNIASNDAIIQTKMNELSGEGWELAFVSSAVESDAGDGDGKGIFITRYVFKRSTGIQK